LRRLQVPEAAGKLANLSTDTAIFRIYRDGDLIETTVAAACRPYPDGLLRDEAALPTPPETA